MKKKKKGKSRGITFILILAFLAGIILLLYPTVSNYWNSLHQGKVISDYEAALNGISDEEYEQMWNAAVEYNSHIRERNVIYTQTDEEKAAYEKLLNICDNGVMGYIDIPVMEVTLPIYHGIDDTILQRAVGHLEWTSLPTGGPGTHCVLSGHRGLPSAKLFTDLDRLEVGDIFTLTILNKVLTYQVDQILIVKPEETEALQITDGEDLCTLVTCTPYGINTHRLLVRGHRIENIDPGIRVTSDAVQVEPLIVASVLAIPFLLIILIIVLAFDRHRIRRSRRRSQAKEGRS